MANDGKSMFSLSSDGVSFEFFNLLWSKDELNFGPSLNFPDTIIFKSGTPSNWYFTASNGRIKRKNRQNLMNARIEEAFTKHLLGYDVIALFIHVANNEDEDPKSGTSAKPMSIEYFDRQGLTDFLYKRRDNSNGILQRFVEPKGIKNEMIRAIWSPKVCLLERSENIHQLHDHRFGLFERCVTFEGPEYYYTSAALRGPVLAGQIQKICEAVVSHISEVTFAQQQVSRMVLNLKVDSRDKIWLLYSTSIRCSGANEDLVAMHMGAPNQDGGEMEDESQLRKSKRDLTRSLVNIDSVIELPGHVNLNPNKSYEKIQMKKRVRCISCARESMEDLRYPITYKSVIKHYEHTLQLMTEVAGRSAGNNVLDWPPDPEIIEAAGGVGFGCLEIVSEYDPLGKPGKMDITKPLEEDELRIPPIIRYIHTNLTSRSYARCRKDPLFLYKTVTVCEGCYLVYAEFTTMLLRLGQDLTKLLKPDPAAVRAAAASLEQASLDRPSSADWRAMSSVNRDSHSDSMNSGRHQAGYVLPSKNFKKAKKEAIGLRTHDARAKPNVPGTIRKNDGGVSGVLRNSQSMAESMGQSMDSMAHMQGNQRDMALTRGKGLQGGNVSTAGAVQGSAGGGSALRYDGDDVNAMIQQREKNFFAEVSLNPQLKDQHPLMHLITSQQKLRMVDEQAGVFMTAAAARAEPVFSTKYGKQSSSNAKKFQSYMVEQPYIIAGTIIKPSKLRKITEGKKAASRARNEVRRTKKKLLRSMNSTELEAYLPVHNAAPDPSALSSVSPLVRSLSASSFMDIDNDTDTDTDTASEAMSTATISAHDMSSKKHSEFLMQTLEVIEQQVRTAAKHRDKSVKTYTNARAGIDEGTRTKGFAEYTEKLNVTTALPELIPPKVLSNGKPGSANSKGSAGASGRVFGAVGPSSLTPTPQGIAPLSPDSSMGGGGFNDLGQDSGFLSQGSLVGSGDGFGLPPMGLDTNSAVMMGGGGSPDVGDSGLMMETFDGGDTGGWEGAPGTAGSLGSFDDHGRPSTSATFSRPNSVEGME